MGDVDTEVSNGSSKHVGFVFWRPKEICELCRSQGSCDVGATWRTVERWGVVFGFRVS